MPKPMINIIKQFCLFWIDLIKSRRLILDLTINDFRTKYLGSYLGIMWAFIQPSITILIFWFVFEVGFKSKPMDNCPFILWLMAGIIPWFLFSEGVMNATNSILDNSYLVKKVSFRVSVLPIIKILSALIIHVFFLGVTFLMFFILGYRPNVYSIQLIYYLFCLSVLVIGISWATSSLAVYFRDTNQIVSVFLQFGFWLTPVFWSFDILPVKYYFIVRLNPVYYIVQGYRESLIYHEWFWNSPNITLYFWVETLALFFIGAILFKNLKPYFADEL